NHDTLIGLGARLDEEAATVGQLGQRERGDLARTVGDQGALCTALDLTGPDIQAIRVGVGDTGAAGLSHELGAETDEATGGNTELHADPVGTRGGGHRLHEALAVGQQLGDVALVLGWDVNDDDLVRLVQLAVDGLGDHLWLAHGQLEALAAHGLNEDGQCHLATALNLPGVGALGRLDLEGDVTDQFLIQAGLDHAGGQLVAAATAGHRGGVDTDGHGQCRLINGDAGQGDRVVQIGEGIADHDVLDAGDGGDVTGDNLLCRDTGETDGGQQLSDLGGLGVLVAL